MSFPSNIKGFMKDCILSVLWPKQDIYTFLSDHGCTSSDLKIIAQFIYVHPISGVVKG